jgi:Alginate lyase
VTGLCHHQRVVSRIRSVGTRFCVLIAAACVLAACSTSSPPPPPPPAPPAPAVPGAPTLDGWKLTLPTANAKGDAAIVDPARPSPPYLTTDAAGALVFWAPVNGATTKNSDHARTELNSLTNFTVGTGKHSLTGSATVNQVPSDAKDVIIAQIHGADDISSVPFVMLHWNDGELKVVVKTVQKGSASQDYPLTSGIPLGAKFDFGITDNGDGTLAFTANYNGDTPQATGPLPPAFYGATVRFQAGAYQQSLLLGTAGPDDGARVTFSALTAS